MNRRLLFAVALGAALAAGWVAFQRPGEAPAAAKHKVHTLTVETTVAATRSMPIRLTAVGRVQSRHVVQVRPQVSGMLKKVAFTEGDEVRAGQLLFEIDPAPFEAALAQARAALERDQAALAKARWQEQRLAPLAKLDYVTPLEYQDARAASKEAAAAVAADRATVTQAQIQLRYTRIDAPIAGRSGAVGFREGNLVQANSTTPLVTIKEIAPILVQFSVPQGRLAEIRRYRAAGSMRVVIQPAGPQPQAAETGRVVFVDNTIDPTTGTVSLKAEFPNTDRALWPGQYVSVDLVLANQTDAVVIPDSAVQPGQNGSYVYVVDGGRAHVRAVTLDRQLDGLSVISAGLKAGETVVAKVPRNLRDGSAVRAVSAADEDRAARPGDTTQGQPAQRP